MEAEVPNALTTADWTAESRAAARAEDGSGFGFGGLLASEAFSTGSFGGDVVAGCGCQIEGIQSGSEVVLTDEMVGLTGRSRVCWRSTPVLWRAPET